MKNRDLIMFSRQLAAMIEAGVPILEALQALVKQWQKRDVRKILVELSSLVESGTALSAAMARYPQTFSRFYVGVVRTGEASGRLSDSLRIMADYLDQNYLFVRKVRSALMYPAFVLVGVIAVVIVMFIFVMPQLATLFNSAQVELPLTTRLMIGTSNFLSSWWWLILVILAALGFILRSYLKTDEGRYTVSDIFLRVPVISFLFSRIYLARLTSVLQTLFRSDVPVIEVLEIARDSIGSAVYEKILDKTIAAVHDGAAISSVWQKEHFIPPMLSTMVSVGERSGEVEDAFDRAKVFFERDVEEVLESITTFLEPILVILMGIGVAIVVAGVLMPIYNLVLVL